MVLTRTAAQQRLWKCYNMLPMSQVIGITIGCLFQSSKASLTTLKQLTGCIRLTYNALNPASGFLTTELLPRILSLVM